MARSAPAAVNSDGSDAAVEAALASIDKQWGPNSIMRMGDDIRMEIETIRTGALTLDIALGIGGLPRGRIVELYGPESSGKTSLAMHIVAEAQKVGGRCAYIDNEHAVDPIYAAAIGVDVANLFIAQPETGEQTLDITEKLVKSHGFSVVVVDSVAAMVPRSELEGEFGDATVGVHARMMSQGMRKLAGEIHRSNTLVIFINQIREKIGVMFGSPETQPGGRALKYYSSVRLDIRRVEAIKEDGEVVANRTRVKVVKNKVAPPFRQAEFDIIFGEGISQEGCLIDVGEELGVVTKGGAWYSYNGNQLGQGREKAKQFLAENPDVYRTIEDQVLELALPGKNAGTE